MINRNIITELHIKTKRNYLQRMNNNKVDCMKIASKYDFDYWDGDRKFGYGGYKYINNYWTPVAKSLIEIYSLKDGSKILDIGCGKAFLLYEIKKLNPNIETVGIDISRYALKQAKSDFPIKLLHHDARKKILFEDNSFDLVISLGTLHNFKLYELKEALSEIQRLGKNKFIMVESFRNELELFNLQCWALTAKTFLDKDEWIWLFQNLNYTGDFEFIYFE